VLVRRDGPAARVTLSRPDKRNALSLEATTELLGVLRQIGGRGT
jgi:enoyl-CoA hydratase/carnithine racemase